MKPRAAGIAAAAGLLVSGCGGSPSALKQTADRLADIHSGVVSLRFSLTPVAARQGVGVELRGPFSLAGKGPLPVARIAYVQQAGVTRRATFISTGRQAFVSTGGRTVRLSADRVKGLRLGSSGQAHSLDDLGLHVDRWIDSAKTSAGPRLDGQRTERISGSLNASEALGELARASGGASGLTAADAKRLSRAVSSSSVQVITGKDDHLLRRLRLAVDLSVPRDLRPKLGGRIGLRIRLGFGISKPNRPVHVTAPAGARSLP